MWDNTNNNKCKVWNLVCVNGLLLTDRQTDTPSVIRAVRYAVRVCYKGLYFTYGPPKKGIKQEEL